MLIEKRRLSTSFDFQLEITVQQRPGSFRLNAKMLRARVVFSKVSAKQRDTVIPRYRILPIVLYGVANRIVIHSGDHVSLS